MNYVSERKFNITDFFLSHSQILIRSSKGGVNNNFNIDIIFFGVKFIQTPTLFNGISIKRCEFKDVITNNLIKGRIDYEGDNLFEIETEKEIFFIGAAFFRVYENELRFNESSLGMIDIKGRDKILFDSLEGA